MPVCVTHVTELSEPCNEAVLERAKMSPTHGRSRPTLSPKSTFKAPSSRCTRSFRAGFPCPDGMVRLLQSGRASREAAGIYSLPPTRASAGLQRGDPQTKRSRTSLAASLWCSWKSQRGRALLGQNWLVSYSSYPGAQPCPQRSVPQPRLQHLSELLLALLRHGWSPRGIPSPQGYQSNKHSPFCGITRKPQSEKYNFHVPGLLEAGRDRLPGLEILHLNLKVRGQHWEAGLSATPSSDTGLLGNLGQVTPPSLLCLSFPICERGTIYKPLHRFIGRLYLLTCT